MGGQQSQQVSFDEPVQNHIRGIFDLALAIKNKNAPLQHQSVNVLKRNVEEWVDILNTVVPGGMAGTLMSKSLQDSVGDEIQLAFGILNCKCKMGKYGQCENGKMLRTALAEVQQNHEKTVRALSAVLGDEEKWRKLWAHQLLCMDNYFTLLANGATFPQLAEAKTACYQSGKNLALALNKKVGQT